MVLAFEDHPEFRPRLTPKQCIRAGVFGGIYFNPRGGKAGVLGRAISIDPAEFPADWFAGLPDAMYRARRYDKRVNKYGVVAGSDQATWERKGWIHPQDPRGWFQWYCRFFLGRRTPDDARQIRRWLGVAGPRGRWRAALVNRLRDRGARADDPSISPVIHQTLLHWAYKLQPSDLRK